MVSNRGRPVTLGTTAQLSGMIAEDADCHLAAETWDFYYTPKVSTWESMNHLVGNGYCVPLVQEATGAPPTSLWRKGPKVKTNRKVPEGTAIATFDENGLYPDKPTGNHAAIFLSVKVDGIDVVDQWKMKSSARPSRRTLRFRNGNGSASNDGDRFWVIVTPKIHSPSRKAGPG
jgi:hypothetical protein